MKGADIIIKMLKMHGVRVVFGYPGASVLDIYHAIRAEGIRHVLTAAENGAITAADGYARASSSLGVVIATSGPGASNLITGLAAANLDGTPLIAITGNVPSTSLGTDSFQEVDSSGLAMPISKYSRIVKNAETLPETLAEAMSIALSGRKGAVLLDIPQDVQQADISIGESELYDILARYRLTDNCTPITPHADTADIIRAAEIINNAEKPVVLIGGGVRLANAQNETAALADALNCPVVTTLMGVSLYDNSARSYLGLTGVYGNPAANHALKTADAIISLGVRFNDRLRASGSFNNKTLIQLDIDDAENGKTLEAEIYIKGDLKHTLPPLTKRLKRTDGEFIERLIAYRLKVGRGDNRRLERNAYAAIAASLNERDIVSTDVGAHQMNLVKNYALRGTFLTNGGLGAMGWGLGAAIGALTARLEECPDSKGVLISGDGSFNMELAELATAVGLKLPLIVIIFNNNSLEMFRAAQEARFGYEYMARPCGRIDYVMLAESMGARGVRAKSVCALKSALSSFNGMPLVIDFELQERP